LVKGRRHPGDLVRLVVALALVALTTLVALKGNISASEADAFRLFNDLPRIFTAIALPLLVLGSPVAIVGAAIAALAQRRWRLAIELVVAGGAAYGVARLLQHVVGRPGPTAALAEFHHVSQLVVSDKVTLGTGFPSAALAVSAALATAAGPHVRRPVGRAVWWLVLGVALARMYAGLDLPLDVVAGVAVGWAVGAALNLALGTPSGHPSPAQVHDALSAAGVEVASLVPVGMGGRSYARFLATSADGEELFVKVLGSEERSADLLMRLWRFVAFRGFQDELAFVSRKRTAEHEALMALTAAQAGVRVPHVQLATRGQRGEVFLVEERVRGHTLDDVPVESIDDKLLERVWEQVERLHAARIAHRDLRRHNVLVDEAGEPWLLDFNLAEAASPPRRLHRDVVELLVSLTAVVGPTRAADSALESLGSDEVMAAMPMLQPLAISGRTLAELPGRQGVIAELRSHVADRLGVEHEPLAQVTRVRPRTIVALLAFGFAVQLLLPQVGEFSQTVDAITSAHWAWMLAAAAAAAATFVAAALAQRGAVEKRLPMYPMTMVQVACSFVNRVTPAGTGGLGLNERHLEKSGLTRPSALAAIGLNALAGAVVHALGVAVAIAALGQSGIGGAPLPRGWGVLVAVTIGFAVAGIVFLSPLRRRIAVPMKRAATDLVRVVRRPLQALQLFSGNIGVTLGNALALAACLAAFHANADLLEVIVVYLGGSAVASVSPTPGALGAVEAALVAGLTGVGVAAGPAVAGVLAFRLVTFWAPTIPGAWAFRVVRRKQWA
jgi:uncharacterized membrane protein YbhN (UPF0104 family)/tRNA A-37 threonylcarbamoyl transferase component Bud32